MIKFKIDGKDKPMLGFGISAENVESLKQGKPIVIDLSEMGVNIKIGIFYGETTGDLIKLVQPFIGDQTIIHDHLEDAPISEAQITELRAAGYTVRAYKNKGYSCGTPLGMSVLRGWAKTESEGWGFCWQHYQRHTKETE